MEARRRPRSALPTRPRMVAAAAGRAHDPREQLEHRGLAGAVRTDDPQRLARRHLEGDVPQRPEVVLRPSSSRGGPSGDAARPWPESRSRRLSCSSPRRNFFQTSRTSTLGVGIGVSRLAIRGSGNGDVGTGPATAPSLHKACPEAGLAARYRVRPSKYNGRPIALASRTRPGASESSKAASLLVLPMIGHIGRSPPMLVLTPIASRKEGPAWRDGESIASRTMPCSTGRWRFSRACEPTIARPS